MALIKCSEGGKEISDKARNCIHCGCPIKERKIICVECGQEIEQGKNICMNCGYKIKTEEAFKDKANSDYYEQELEIARLKIDYSRIEQIQIIFIILGIIFCLTIFGILFGIVCFFAAAFYAGCKRNNIILTNRRIKGIIKLWGTIESVDIPLDKIDSITCSYAWFNNQKLIITSNTKIRGVVFTLNTEDFCEITLKEIEKYKEYIYRKER